MSQKVWGAALGSQCKNARAFPDSSCNSPCRWLRTLHPFSSVTAVDSKNRRCLLSCALLLFPWTPWSFQVSSAVIWKDSAKTFWCWSAWCLRFPSSALFSSPGQPICEECAANWGSCLFQPHFWISFRRLRPNKTWWCPQVVPITWGLLHLSSWARNHRDRQARPLANPHARLFSATRIHLLG